MSITSGNIFTVRTTSIQGVQVDIGFNGDPAWLKHNGEEYTATTNAALTSGSENNKQTSSTSSMSLYAGSKKDEITFSLDTAQLAGAKPATVTLKNKTGGKDCVFIVIPDYIVPTVSLVANTASPTQNTFSGTTIKLYKVSGSKIQIKTSAIGGTQIQNVSGVTVAAVASTDNYHTDRTYTVTWNGSATSASFHLVNSSDDTKKAAITVLLPSPAITVPAGAATVSLIANQGGSKTGISSPEGFTVAANTINWGGGAAWFDLTTTNANSGTQNVGFKVKAGLANTVVIKEATVTLTNKITNGGNTTFTVKPVFQAPTLNLTSGSVIKGNSIQFTGTVYGGVTASINNGVATVNVGSDKKTITVTGVSVGTGTITVKNASDGSKTATFSITVKDVVLPPIGGIKWAAGNLVRVNATSCKIGNPGDYGVHFRFGSLIGYDSQDKTTNPLPVVKPSNYSGNPNFLNAPYATGEIVQNAAGGLGDPCKHYLGGTWRLPTADEYRNSLGGGVSGTATFTDWKWVTNFKNENGSNISGVYLRNSKSDKVFFPAAGSRYGSNGQHGDSGSYGYCWTSTPTGDRAFCLYFYSGGASMYHYRGDGFSIRCVQE